MHPDWARSLRDQCQAAGVPFFFKQWGEWAPWGDSSCKYLMDFNCDQADRKFKSTVISPCVFYRVGKKAAGRELDGQVWEQYPEAKP
jgi:protein gp37